MMDEVSARNTGRLAIAAGVVAAGSALSLATYFAVGGPFGTINDVGNAAAGVLGGCLAFRLRGQLPGRLGDVAVAAAVVGAALTVVGSALVVSHTTGFFLAGLVSSVGFAGIGGWLVALARRAPDSAGGAGLRAIGLVAGSLMALGVLAAPGIYLRLDDMASAPAWVYVGLLGWLGIYVVFPIWSVAWGVSQIRAAGASVGRSQDVATAPSTIEVS